MAHEGASQSSEIGVWNFGCRILTLLYVVMELGDSRNVGFWVSFYGTDMTKLYGVRF